MLKLCFAVQSQIVLLKNIVESNLVAVNPVKKFRGGSLFSLKYNQARNTCGETFLFKASKIYISMKLSMLKPFFDSLLPNAVKESSFKFKYLHEFESQFEYILGGSGLDRTFNGKN